MSEPALQLQRGSRPLVVVAPHGGRRARPVRRDDGMNDLYTAELALELAERLDAWAVINGDLDRNVVDLNRISALERAPVFVDELERAIDGAARVAAGCRPLLLFVHGWNVVQPACDLGLGLREQGGRLSGRWPTLSGTAWRGVVARLRAELEINGVWAPVGWRYPAWGADNVLQLFSGRHDGHDDARLAAIARLAAADRVDAVQLELSVPLRWPGPWRESFLAATELALVDYEGANAAGGDSVAGRAAVVIETRTAGPSRARPGWQVVPRGLPEVEQAEDALVRQGAQPLNLMALLSEEGDAIFAGVEPAGRGAVLARVCLLLADGRMALFTSDSAEDLSAADCPRLQLDREQGGGFARLRLRAAVVLYPSHLAYLDLERGMAESELSTLELDLRWTADSDGSDFGRLSGRVELRGEKARSWPVTTGQTAAVDAFAVLQSRGRDAGRDGARARFFCDPGGVSGQGGVATPGVLLLDAEQASMPGQGDAAVVPGTGEVQISDPGSDLESADLLTRVPLWRPLGERVYLRWSFGVARCRLRGNTHDTPALFDSAELFGADEVDS